MTWPINLLLLAVIAFLSYVAGRAHQVEIDVRPIRKARLPLASVLSRAERARLEIPAVRRR